MSHPWTPCPAHSRCSTNAHTLCLPDPSRTWIYLIYLLGIEGRPLGPFNSSFWASAMADKELEQRVCGEGRTLLGGRAGDRRARPWGVPCQPCYVLRALGEAEKDKFLVGTEKHGHIASVTLADKGM